VVRATLRQRMHQFDAALEDLAIVLNANPRNARRGSRERRCCRYRALTRVRGKNAALSKI
jgi:hypothetical protein